ncbi:LuxR family transcriptional regulator [Novispirillum sp. DQ9]|uniref:LuxR family transcriptional regulator n=1 Tax=Novispirillum sp. DQ9 TaxID=3398612 RepID=UPI003C7EA7DE
MKALPLDAFDLTSADDAPLPLGDCLAFSAAAARAASMGDLRAALETFLRALRTPQYAFMAANIAGSQMRDPVILTNYPEAWQKAYINGNYVVRDPVVRGMQYRQVPMVWGSRAEYEGLSPEGRRHYEEAAEHGLRIGVIVPMYFTGQEYATFAVAVDEPEDTFLPRAFTCGAALQIVGPHLYAAVRRLHGGAHVEAEPLTRREAECLGWAAQGKSMADIGLILGVSRTTVIFHITNARRKLGVDNLQAAVARAMSLGYVCTDDTLKPG